MQNTRMLRLFVTCVLLVAAAPAQQRYSAARAGDIVRLADSRANVTVSVLTTTHNAYEIVANGHNILRTAYATLDELRDKPGHNGIPLLAPFANRLDEPAFYANGRKYNFDMELGNMRGGAIPIHGFVTGSKDWELVDMNADGQGAWVTSRLDFYRNPQYMKQFPFAHTISMTYRLADGALEVRTRLDNASREPMPVAIGFHPYFELTESSREDWTLSIPAKTHWLLAPNKIPTGQTQPIEKLLADPRNVALKGLTLDDGFSDLERDSQGRGVVTLKGKTQQIDVLLGPKFKVVLVYLPQVQAAGASKRGSVAIEPMAGVTNSMNLAHKGLYKELQSVSPGGSWEESFWIRPRGFYSLPRALACALGALPFLGGSRGPTDLQARTATYRTARPKALWLVNP
jgi:aldose 1-epimerase